MLQDTMKNATLADIGKSAPELGLDKLIAALTPKGQTPSVILLDEPEFWPKFSKLITRHSKAAVHGYMMWQAINKLAPIVDSPDLHDLLDITPGNGREQWDLCIDAAGLSVGHILNSYFVKATYPDLTLKAADKMTTNVRNAFVKRLGELDWMSPDSKKRAIKKAENIVQNIGYPTEKPDLRSAESLASYYTGMNITNDHFSNMLSARAHKMAKGYAEVANPPDRNIFGEINIVNAFYAPWLNTITIPAGISQLPFFHHHLPLYALYGGLGSVVGHEISHGFDDEGRLWSEDHELETWWDNSTVENFEKGAQCFVDQYSKFEVETPSGMLTVDGENTLGENLADAGGLRASFNAWNEERGKMPGVWDQSLPGLEGFTHEQLFFIFYGNSWCEAPSKQLNAMSVDPRRAHSPSLIRIKGSAENSAAFQEAFKCKSKPKCELF
jgi:endothelin-converting enzyme